MAAGEFIEFRGITKTFGGVVALNGVTLSIARGECHGLMGEKRCGQVDARQILAGIYQPTSGEIAIDGESHDPSSPRAAQATGIAMVHQELAFCSDLSVAENLSMGRYPRKLHVLLDRTAMEYRAEKLLSAIGVELDVRRPLRELSTAQEQKIPRCKLRDSRRRNRGLCRPRRGWSE